MLLTSAPESRGSVRLTSAEPDAPPAICLNALAEPGDRAFFRRMVAQVRDLLRSDPLNYVTGAGLTLPDDAVTTEALDDWVRANINAGYHPAGTCAMGQGPDAVVDNRLKVHGLDGLYVADASIMPKLVRANTNATCLMIGERASEFILAG